MKKGESGDHIYTYARLLEVSDPLGRHAMSK